MQSKPVLTICIVILTVFACFLWLPAQINNPPSSGSGTVSANNGSAGALANYAAAGGSTTVGPDANLVDSGGTLTSAVNITPNVNGTLTLGTGTNRWNNLLTVGVTASGTVGGGAYSNSGSGHLTIGGNPPTISSGFGTTPTVPNQNGTIVFQINVGTGGTATSGVIATGTTATTGWGCAVNNLTASAGNRADNTVQTASTTTTVSVQNQTKSTGAAVAWTASDILQLNCFAF